MEEDKELTQFVWGKASTEYPYWPGIIITRQEEAIDGAQHVFFFGTHDTAWVREQYILPYLPNKEIFQSECNSLKFKAALQEIEENIVKTREGDYTFPIGDVNCRKRIKPDISNHNGKQNKPSMIENVASDTNEAVSTVGVINTKEIGDVIVEKLPGENYTINIWNPNEKQITTKSLVNYKSFPCDVLQNSDITFICMKDQKEVLNLLEDDFKLGDSNDSTLRNKRLLLCTTCHPEVINDINKKLEQKGGSLLDVAIDNNNETLLLHASGNKVLYDVCHNSFFKLLGSSYYYPELGYATKMNLCMSLIAKVCNAGLEECSSLARVLSITKEDYSHLASGVGNYLTEKWNSIKEKNFVQNERSLVDVHSTMTLLMDSEIEDQLKVNKAIYNIIEKCVSLNYGYNDISIIFGSLSKRD